MVNPVLRFVDEKETVTAASEGESNTKQTNCTIAKAFQRDCRSWFSIFTIGRRPSK